MAANENGGGGADARLSVYAHCAMASCPAGLAAAGLVLQVCLAASLASLAASLAAAGPLQGRCRAAAGPLHSPPLLMVLLL